MNLLRETIEVLERHDKVPGDVVWVGSSDLWTNWGNFAKAADVEYDEGYGAQEVPDGLLVVGKDWWLERHEYDSSEWWEFKCLPARPVQQGVITTITEGQQDNGFLPWDSLLELKGNYLLG